MRKRSSSVEDGFEEVVGWAAGTAEPSTCRLHPRGERREHHEDPVASLRLRLVSRGRCEPTPAGTLVEPAPLTTRNFVPADEPMSPPAHPQQPCLAAGDRGAIGGNCRTLSPSLEPSARGRGVDPGMSAPPRDQAHRSQRRHVAANANRHQPRVALWELRASALPYARSHRSLSPGTFSCSTPARRHLQVQLELRSTPHTLDCGHVLADCQNETLRVVRKA